MYFNHDTSAIGYKIMRKVISVWFIALVFLLLLLFQSFTARLKSQPSLWNNSSKFSFCFRPWHIPSWVFRWFSPRKERLFFFFCAPSPRSIQMENRRVCHPSWPISVLFNRPFLRSELCLWENSDNTFFNPFSWLIPLIKKKLGPASKVWLLLKNKKEKIMEGEIYGDSWTSFQVHQINWNWCLGEHKSVNGKLLQLC